MQLSWKPGHRPMDMKLSLFAPASDRTLGERVAAALGTPPAPLEERDFEDGEHKSRPLASVRGHDAYVLTSLVGDAGRHVNDKLVRLLFLLATLKDAGAARITAVVPYLCYARKDRRTKARDPVTVRYLAALFESTGLDRIVTVDVHNLAAYQNAFRIPAEHLEARFLFADHLRGLPGPLAVLSPDVGGIKRAEAFRQTLSRLTALPVAGGFMEKYRSAGEVSGESLIADVAGHTVLLVDDLVASGTTLVRAARACRSAGAARVIALATHGVFAAAAGDVLSDPALDRLIVTNTIAGGRIAAPAVQNKLQVLDITGLIAEAIRRLHENGSLVELVDPA